MSLDGLIYRQTLDCGWLFAVVEAFVLFSSIICCLKINCGSFVLQVQRHCHRCPHHMCAERPALHLQPPRTSQRHPGYVPFASLLELSMWIVWWLLDKVRVVILVYHRFTRHWAVAWRGLFLLQLDFRIQIFQKAVKKKKGFEMDFECDFSPFWIQTITWSEPYSCEKKEVQDSGYIHINGLCPVLHWSGVWQGRHGGFVLIS